MSKRITFRLAFIGLFIFPSIASALDTTISTVYSCEEGNCLNGQGKVWDKFRKFFIEGTWTNGKSIPNEKYTVTSPVDPDRKFSQIFGEDGKLKFGDFPTGQNIFAKGVPYFSGEYIKIDDPFIKNSYSAIKSGLYNDGFKTEYRGRFEFLPTRIEGQRYVALPYGYFIFYGDKVDIKEDKKETGLYVSDLYMLGANPTFTKADAAYLVAMQKKYQFDIAQSKIDFKEWEAEKQWVDALALIGNIAMSFSSASGSSGVNSSSTGDIALKIVSKLLQNSLNAKGSKVKEFAKSAVAENAIEDKKLNDAINKAIDQAVEN